MSHESLDGGIPPSGTEDVSALIERERRLRARLEALHRAGVAISASRDLLTVLHTIIDQARLITGARFAALGLLDSADPRQPFSRWISEGLSPAQLTALGRLSPPGAGSGALRLGQESQLFHLEEAPGSRELLAGELRMSSLLVVPIASRDRTVGYLYLASEAGAAELTEEDKRTMGLLAQQAIIAVEHARTHQLVLQINEQILQEVSARKQAELALRESEERYRLLAEHARDVIFRYRLVPDRRVEYVSPSIWDLTGYAPEELYADPALLLRIIDPEDRPVLEHFLATPASFEGPLVLRWVSRERKHLWVELRVTPLYNSAGTLTGLVGIARDITRRVRAKEERERLLTELADQRSWLEAVIEHSPVGLLLFRNLGQFRANRRAEALLGRRILPAEGPEQYLPFLFHPDGRPVAVDELPSGRALRGEEVPAQEFIVRQQEGREFPVLGSAAPIHDGAGRLIGAIVAIEDISSLKELERLREEWTSVVAHDLRQPVSVIAYAATALERQLEGTPSQTKARAILKSGRQLGRMIEDLLDLSRLDVHRLTLLREEVDLQALVHTVVEQRAPELEGRPLSIEPQGQVPKVSADPARIEQVLGNLLSNAVKYGFPGTGIRVVLERAGDEVQVTVTNSGKGIEPEDLGMLFRRFHRTKMARQGRIAGTGLGLYIIEGLVKAHGGRIWVESIPEQTTSFHFTLPLESPSREKEGKP